MNVDPRGLDALPRDRLCTACKGPTRTSHNAYAGSGETVAVHVCTRCGTTFRGALRTATERDAAARKAIDERRARRDQRSGRRALDQGGPDNPVLDDETAARLRDLLGGG